MTVPQEEDDTVNAKKMSRGSICHYGFASFKKLVPHQITNITVFLLIRKQKTCTPIFCNHFRPDGSPSRRTCTRE